MSKIKVTQNYDATKHLGCATCQLHNNCSKYALICDFINNRLFFGAKLLCGLERAENAATKIRDECSKNNFSNPAEMAKTLYKDYLPAFNNLLNTFYILDYEHASEYAKRAVIFTLAESLERWGLLEYFDFIYFQNVKNARNDFQTKFEHEITKSERKKLM